MRHELRAVAGHCAQEHIAHSFELLLAVRLFFKRIHCRYCRREEPTGFVRDSDLHGFIHTGHVHKEVGVLVASLGVLERLVVFHSQRVGEASSEQNHRVVVELALDLLLLVERHLASSRLVQDVQTLNLRVHERDQTVGVLHSWRQAALVEVHGLHDHHVSFDFGQAVGDCVVVHQRTC